MAMAMKGFTQKIIDDIALEQTRGLVLINIANSDNPSNTDKLLLEWINELKDRVIKLECANQNLHRICGTTAFNPTQG